MIDEESFVGVDVEIVTALLGTSEGVGSLKDGFLTAIDLETFKGGEESTVSTRPW